MSPHRVDVFRRWQEEEQASVGRIMKVGTGSGLYTFQRKQERPFSSSVVESQRRMRKKTTKLGNSGSHEGCS